MHRVYKNEKGIDHYLFIEEKELFSKLFKPATKDEVRALRDTLTGLLLQWDRVEHLSSLSIGDVVTIKTLKPRGAFPHNMTTHRRVVAIYPDVDVVVASALGGRTAGQPQAYRWEEVQITMFQKAHPLAETYGMYAEVGDY